jgi:hypothetical protein
MRVAGQDGEDFVELAMGDGTKLELFGAGAVDAARIRPRCAATPIGIRSRSAPRHVAG